MDPRLKAEDDGEWGWLLAKFNPINVLASKCVPRSQSSRGGFVVPERQRQLVAGKAIERAVMTAAE
ncbi:UNVERIFIED_ORG: hypothetical protein GGE13_001356 [Rhizobium etli]